MAAWTCFLCGVHTTGVRARSRHMQNYYRDASDPLRCDNILSGAVINRAAVPVEVPFPVEVQPSDEEYSIDLDGNDVDGNGNDETVADDNDEGSVDTVDADNNAVVREARFGEATSYLALARRAPACRNLESIKRERSYTIDGRLGPPPIGCKDFSRIQDSWDVYLGRVKNLVAPEFWTFFLAMHNLSGVAIDTALKAVKQAFHFKTAKSFPTSRRYLLQKITKIPSFWDLVMHKKRIDISSFGLNVKHVDFEFVDPIWGWIMAARSVPPSEMHWLPEAASTTTGESLYGGGVQHGLAFASAHASCPDGSYTMGISLHWDGTGSRGVHTTPICCGVANTNTFGSNIQYLLGYMPVLTGMGKSFYSSTKSTELKFFLRQASVAAILSVLDNAATSGFLCRLKNCNGVDVKRILMPRLMCMNLDQPEAQLFFGIQNRYCCTKCKRRVGHSAFRKAGCPTRSQVQLLYNLVVNGSTQEIKTKAGATLKRWGYNKKRKCCLLSDSCDRLLVHVPRYPEVFPSADYRDRMHALMVSLFDQVILGFRELTGVSARQKRLFDARLCIISRERTLTMDGKMYRCPKSLYSDDGLSAADRTAILFLLPHVIGPLASELPEYSRVPMLIAVTHAQLCIIASRGLRSFTECELLNIFDKGYVLIYRALETLHAASHDSFDKKVRYYVTMLQPHRI